jgi:hypothetical protein
MLWADRGCIAALIWALDKLKLVRTGDTSILNTILY